jgi:hypothetical protein
MPFWKNDEGVDEANQIQVGVGHTIREENLKNSGRFWSRELPIRPKSSTIFLHLFMFLCKLWSRSTRATAPGVALLSA